MQSYSQEEVQNALKVVSSSINKCEKIQAKFQEGTSQHSLLRNRIKALKITKYLMENDSRIQAYTIDDLEKSLPPVISIIQKTEKAQSKYDKVSTQFKRFIPLIEAMYMAKSFILNEISERTES